ncbi:MAG: Xaa-Pro peptidase family protein [SAR202 cluster bacterium]|jgi:Xaa-Pro dipeptidase|nr:Xaa-Pro peptidase family protein [SAR202 cluster bacterium]MDP6301533.1 Xaa-Pro peptidase family protein [SAR202 cluster bacterium]MDP7103028.1 Xaa-Pro peptidase family protein [SAR202 cluster bacterium]MDP7224607.1 Xaa-Pro peptidase family protein [SAR202 cluster bacterium]HJO81701.1 Xaa-Pro peptidase family protein [SAR202 cluster bacterium]|tara:strand:- start:438 stop:1688 length:1251 start_codon:yes stop_codon:yes gene_type:complete
MPNYGSSSFGLIGTDWQQRINWDRLRVYRLERARAAMRKHGLGAMLCMYDENIRYTTSTITPGWCRLKPGLRYALLCEGSEPILFEQGDIGTQINRHCPWIPTENVRYAYSWIKGAVGPAAKQQVTKFTNAIVEEMKKYGVQNAPLGTDFVDLNMMNAFKEAGINWTDGASPMVEARSIKNEDELEIMRIVAAICDGCHTAISHFMRPGMRENEITAFAMNYLYNIPGVEDVEDVIVSSGPNSWPNWRNFSDRIIQPGELVIIDMAAVTWNGYKSCQYRTYCVGKQPTQEQKEYYKIAYEWLYDAIDKVRPGATTRDIVEVWPSAQEAWGYVEEDQAAANLWGHGLGLAQYDTPVVSRIYSLDHPVEIQPGMSFALETQHGKPLEWGVRVEEMMVVTESGPEITTRFPIEEMTVLD